VVVDLHLMDNRDPFVYKTEDFGKTWTNITGNLPKGPLAYARVIAENPNRRGMLFVGTGNALYYSMDEGADWKQLKDGLPPAPVSWIVVQKNYHDLVVSTYGRGFYILEDLSPLEQNGMESGLFAPRPTYRMTRGSRALLNFDLKTASKDPVKIEILDAAGKPVREITAPGRAGLNRTSWDLRYDPPRRVALRTTPPENPHIWEEPRFANAKTRPITHWGIAQAEVGPIAAPGKYTVKLTADGETYTQSLEVKLPPDSHGSEGDIQSAVRLQLKVRDDISTVSDMTNQLEVMRKTIEDDHKKFAGKEDLLEKLNAIDEKMQTVEYNLISRSEALSDDKYYIEQYKLYLQLIWLNGEIGTGAGDVAGTGDYGPTETSIGLVVGLEREIEKVKGEFKNLLDKDVPAYNQAIGGTGLAPLSTTAPAAATTGGGNR